MTQGHIFTFYSCACDIFFIIMPTIIINLHRTFKERRAKERRWFTLFKSLNKSLFIRYQVSCLSYCVEWIEEYGSLFIFVCRQEFHISCDKQEKNPGANPHPTTPLFQGCHNTRHRGKRLCNIKKNIYIKTKNNYIPPGRSQIYSCRDNS